MTKVLLDQGLPRSSVIWLRQAGWDAVHVYEMGLSRARDKDILDYARAERRTCITLNADFHAIVAVANDTAPSVIRLRLEGLRGQGLAELILRIWPQIESQVRHGALVTVTTKAIRVRVLPIERK